MLQCTEAAATMVKQARERQGLPRTYGLRLRQSSLPEESGIEITLEASPAPGDEVTVSNETRLFVAADLAPKLAALTLDTSSDPQAPGFILRPAAPN